MRLALPPGPHRPKRSFAWLAPQLSGGRPVPEGSPGPGERIPRSSHRGLQAAPAAAPAGAGSAQIPAANRLLRSDGRTALRERGSSVPPRNTRTALPQLKFNKAITSNTAAYSLNTRYFCNPCSASALSPSLFASVLAPPPDGKALQHQGRRRHGPAAFRGRAAPGPRRSSRGTPGTRALTPGPAGRPGQQEAAPLLPALPGDGAVTPRELLLSAGQGWGRRRAGGAAPVPPAPQRREAKNAFLP